MVALTRLSVRLHVYCLSCLFLICVACKAVNCVEDHAGVLSCLSSEQLLVQTVVSETVNYITDELYLRSTSRMVK